MNNTVELSPKLLKEAMGVGLKRVLTAIEADAWNTTGEPNNTPESLVEHIDGAMAEAAYCQFRGVQWIPHDKYFKGADVGVKTQVRSTRWPTGRLRLKETDNDDDYFVLVRQITTFHIVGWIKGAAGKRVATTEAYINPDAPMLLVPNDCLRSFK